MKRCPECGRDYNDDSMSFCLDDGSELLFGPASGDDSDSNLLDDVPTIPHFAGTDATWLLHADKSGEPVIEPDAYGDKRDGKLPKGHTSRNPSGKLITSGRVLALIALSLAVGFIFGIYKYRAPIVSRTSDFSLANPRITKLTTSGRASAAAISPDGKYVVHVQDDGGQQSLYIRQVATESNVQIVPPSAVVFGMMKFSSDGTYVYYSVFNETTFSRGTLFKLPALGGQPRKIKEDINHTQFSFSPDGRRFVFTRNVDESTYQMLIANEDGTGEELVMETRAPNLLDSVAWAPDGERIVYEDWNVSAGSKLFELRLKDRSTRLISEKSWCCGMGNLTWISDSTLILLAADQQASGQIWQVVVPTGEISQLTHDPEGFSAMSLCVDLSILAVVRSAENARIWVGPANDPDAARPITFGSGKADSAPIWLPDGRLLFGSSLGVISGIWTMNSDGSDLRRITPENDNSGAPVLSPDGTRIAFASNHGGYEQHVWIMNADGSEARQITTGEGYVWQRPSDFSPDGRWLYYTDFGRYYAAWKIPLDGSGEAIRVSNKISANTKVSPDGKLIAYIYKDDEKSPFRTAIASIDGGEPLKTFLVCPTCGGSRWSPDGRSLVYIETDENGVSNLMEQPIADGTPRKITDFKFDLIFGFNYSRDGKQVALSRGITTSDVFLYTRAK